MSNLGAKNVIDGFFHCRLTPPEGMTLCKLCLCVCVCVSWWWLEGDRGKGARPKIESNARCDTRISSSSSTVPEDGFEKFTSGFYWVSFNGMAVDFVKCYVLNNLYMWACVCVCVRIFGLKFKLFHDTLTSAHTLNVAVN